MSGSLRFVIALVSSAAAAGSVWALPSFSATALPYQGYFNPPTNVNATGQVAGGLPPDSAASVWDHGVVTPFGLVNGATPYVCWINDLGDCCGYYGESTGTVRPWVRIDGVTRDLGFAGQACSINNARQVVVLDAATSGSHAYLYDANTDALLDLAALGGWPYATTATISRNGWVAGIVNATGKQHAFVTDGNTFTDLSAAAGDYCHAIGGVNTRGQVCAHVTAAGHPYAQAVLYTGGTAITLGTAFGPSDATDLNDDGVVVGGAVFGPDGKTHAFYCDGQLHDIGTFGGTASYAWMIDNAGHIGGSYTTAAGLSHAFLFDIHTQEMVDLNAYNPDPDYYFQSLTGMNEQGMMLVSAFNVTSPGWTYERAYLLEPIPEPGTLGVLALGIINLITRRRIPAFVQSR